MVRAHRAAPALQASQLATPRWRDTRTLSLLGRSPATTSAGGPASHDAMSFVQALQKQAMGVHASGIAATAPSPPEPGQRQSRGSPAPAKGRVLVSPGRTFETPSWLLPECLRDIPVELPDQARRQWIASQGCYLRLAKEKQVLAWRLSQRELAEEKHARELAQTHFVDRLRWENESLRARVALFEADVVTLKAQLATAGEVHRRSALGAKLMLGAKASEVDRMKALEEELHLEIELHEQQIGVKKQSSMNLLEKSVQRQREALERAISVHRELFAAKLIQRHTKARLESQRSDLLLIEARLRQQAAEAAVVDKLTEASAHLQRVEESRARDLETTSTQLVLRGVDGKEQPLGHWMRQLLSHLVRVEHRGGAASNKFSGGSAGIGVITVGRPDSAALGLAVCLNVCSSVLQHQPLMHVLPSYVEPCCSTSPPCMYYPRMLSMGTRYARLNSHCACTAVHLTILHSSASQHFAELYAVAPSAQVEQQALHQRLSRELEAIREEVAACKDAEAQECLEYVLYQRAGSSPLIFPNSPYPRDRDQNGVRADRVGADGLGFTLADFVASREAQKARLSVAHIVALRLYRYTGYWCIDALRA